MHKFVPKCRDFSLEKKQGIIVRFAAAEIVEAAASDEVGSEARPLLLCGQRRGGYGWLSVAFSCHEGYRFVALKLGRMGLSG
jgi:hypothetical protein